MKKILTTLACAVVALATSAIGGEYPDISINELKTAIKDGKVTVIDVNGSAGYAKGHIPGAVDFRATKDLASVLPKDKGALIVAYCGGPSCSAYKAAAEAAEKLGYTNVKHLSAGISGWLQAGEATEKPKASGSQG
ncbi:MAG: rhodanese-like domain-containing protein [Verrucomicrobiales bacterium]|nr:rhodanese-like domain-containing protein [Verrucomicrobiales bacterium]